MSQTMYICVYLHARMHVNLTQHLYIKAKILLHEIAKKLYIKPLIVTPFHIYIGTRKTFTFQKNYGYEASFNVCHYIHMHMYAHGMCTYVCM
jgi:hypothetical protein